MAVKWGGWGWGAADYFLAAGPPRSFSSQTPTITSQWLSGSCPAAVPTDSQCCSTMGPNLPSSPGSNLLCLLPVPLIQPTMRCVGTMVLITPPSVPTSPVKQARFMSRQNGRWQKGLREKRRLSTDLIKTQNNNYYWSLCDTWSGWHPARQHTHTHICTTSVLTQWSHRSYSLFLKHQQAWVNRVILANNTTSQKELLSLPALWYKY